MWRTLNSLYGLRFKPWPLRLTKEIEFVTKKMHFPLNPLTSRHRHTNSLKAKQAETKEDWLFWGVIEALILLPTPEKCVCRPRELLTFPCAVIHGAGATTTLALVSCQ